MNARSIGRRATPDGGTLHDLLDKSLEFSGELVQPVARHRGHGDDGRAFERGSLDEFLSLVVREFDLLGRHEVGLGERNDARADAQQVDDVQMLARLGHDALVGGDDQEHDVHPADAGDASS